MHSLPFLPGGILRQELSDLFPMDNQFAAEFRNFLQGLLASSYSLKRTNPDKHGAQKQPNYILTPYNPVAQLHCDLQTRLRLVDLRAHDSAFEFPREMTRACNTEKKSIFPNTE